MSWYSAGTVSIANGATAVTGAGTAFLSQVKPGDQLQIAGVNGTVAAVPSNTSLTLVKPWAGTTAVATADYLIIHNGSEWHRQKTINQQLADIISRLTAGGNAWVAGEADDWDSGDLPPEELGADGDLAVDIASVPPAIYGKTAGAWVAGQLAGVASIKRTIITASGTHTFDAKHLFCDIECVGGGGGGGGCVGGASEYRGAGGGVGGMWARARKTAAETGSSKAVTIGAAGAGGVGAANGGTGGNTSVGSLCVALGGTGGKYNNNSASWGDGTAAPTGGASVGDILVPGEAGAAGMRAIASTGSNSFSTSGKGGNSRYGGGGAGTVFSAGGGGASGYGGGGGGANAFNATFNGGAGSAGLVIITEYLGP